MAAKDKEPKALPEGEEGGGKKRSKLKKVIIILVILVMTLGGAGIGAYWWFFMRTPSADGGAQAEAAAGGENAPASAAPGGQGAAPDAGAKAGKAEAGGGRVEMPPALPRSAGQVFPLPMVTVNISDPSGRRYLKLGMEVEANANIAEGIKANSARIRDAMIMLVAGKTFAELSSPEGKVLLKAEVAGRLNQILGAQRIIRVYFTDFVVE